MHHLAELTPAVYYPGSDGWPRADNTELFRLEAERAGPQALRPDIVAWDGEIPFLPR